ncbi:TetR/AcrR family transcriptional regulator [Goodfellowiella coeruleoviolacea]|uniref:Transcriptional regulator, TetR family n=1 Tax=Goodfellowiella coeruleoviolacea TaxID=334858 RepID=A0AAE3G9R9_9PSEU|nr:TetR/AcrR family transcriptional regulator [Goodfellowiella coeruleoviolacea]MCP2164276.1 transcriptional regulator, TetR family [Goodfellowiella coeruleoviolacea]
MMSQRRTPALDAAARPAEPARAANAIPEDRILDCAHDLLLAVGMRGLNMAEIARRAGISRATLYRRWPNVTALTAALVTREFAAVVEANMRDDTGTGRERLVRLVVRVAGALRDHPLLRKIVDVDPEFLLPYLLHRRGRSTNHQLALLEDSLRAGIADGSVRPGEVAPRARAVLLTAWSFVLTGPVLASPATGPTPPGPAPTGEVSIEALDAELAALLDRYLAP